MKVTRRGSALPYNCNLSLDPGLSIGWAAWSLDAWEDLACPLEAGSVNESKRHKQWVESMQFTVGCFAAFMRERMWRPQHVYIEWPEFQAGKSKELAVVIGWLMCWASERGAVPTLIGVNEWKGQLPKHVTDKRIEEALGAGTLDDINNHARDAVGIGLYAKGYDACG